MSGSGTNLQALIDAASAGGLGAEIVVVVSDRPGVRALERAERAGIATEVIPWTGDRDTFTERICDTVAAHGAQAMVLAGFMRILAPMAVERFPRKVINIHPSLLPGFPGSNAVEQALEHGVKLTGVTVHFVDEQVDHGPVIAQEAVPVHVDDTPDTLHGRLQVVEHRLYPAVVRAFAAGRLTVDGRKVIWA